MNVLATSLVLGSQLPGRAVPLLRMRVSANERRTPTPRYASHADRYKAGESIADLADDYGEDPLNIEEAVRCELQPAKAA